ncbi:hypothetical protein PVAND_017202 [Polypedilum vanderplanki]|uniref:DEK-C domain-containing protein n=1 Tax=Polypedilum vanderplanki TaxID=319348 RepID=A0A9J6BHY2_POLVA|nr:hypothetical protein PVAND_017202 [Polypedilum vanderplanki]
MASEKEQMPQEKKEEEPVKDNTNGEKNGDIKEDNNKDAESSAGAIQKLSLGEIAAIDGEIAKAKIELLQPLHNVIYGKNGSGPQIKRNIRKFAGFEEEDRQKKLDVLLTFELPALQQTATILDLKDIKPDETKETLAKVIVDFLISPTGKTIAEVQKEEPEEEQEEGEEEEEEDEEDVKPKGSPRKGGKNQSGGRPKRATATRVWTNDYGSSEEEEEEEARPRGRKKRGDSDSGSDYNPSAGSDSENVRRKAGRTPASASRKSNRSSGGRKRKYDSESEEEESEEESENFTDEEEVVSKKKKKTPGRPAARRGAQRGRKRKQETESEEEESEEEESEEDAEGSDDSEKQKKSRKPAPKATPQKNSKGRPKRAAQQAKKKKKDESEDEESAQESEEEDDEPLKKPLKKSATATGDGSKAPSDDDIKTLLKDILAEANLEEITMKTVCKKVYAHYPNHDLSSRKDFIKQTVKSLIAA